MSYENSSSLWTYARKRARRIVPAYLVVVIGAALLLSLASTLTSREYFSHAGLRSYLGYNLILSNFRAPDLPGVFASNPVTAVNGSLWTIKVEVGFYILVPAIVWTVRRFGYRSALITLFVLSLSWRLGFEALGSADGTDIFAKLAKQLPGQLCFFVGGAWAYYRARDGYPPRMLPALFGVVAYALSSGIIFVLIAPIAVTAVVSWAALAGPRLPPVARYGDFSYGVYLYHFPIAQTLVAAGLFAWSPGIALLAVLLAVACASVTSWYLVEAPALAGKPGRLPVARPRVIS
jgi:peptidoglycan/LPS O-acetylase OafA/YrhL